MARTYQKLELHQEKEAAMRNATKLAPKNIEVFQVKSYVELVDRNKKDFLTTIGEARSLYPSDIQLLYYQGLGLLTFEDKHQGCDIIKDVIKNNNINREILTNAMYIYNKYCIEKK